MRKLIKAGSSNQRAIRAADDGNPALDDAMSDMKADFDYVMDGLDRMSRMGGDSSKRALSLALEFNASIGNMISTVANEVGE